MFPNESNSKLQGKQHGNMWNSYCGKVILTITEIVEMTSNALYILLLSEIKTRSLFPPICSRYVLSSHYCYRIFFFFTSVQVQGKFPHFKIHLTVWLRSYHLTFNWKWLICSSMLKGKKNLTESYKCFQLMTRLLKPYTSGINNISLHITLLIDEYTIWLWQQETMNIN